MGEKLKRIALVGCGGMARLYRHIYTQIEGAQLYMLIDCNEEVARKAAEELGVPQYSTRFEDCLCDEVDIVDISTPNFLHKYQAIEAIKAGKSVLVQKPVTVTVQEAVEIAEAQKRYGAKVGVYMELRAHPVYNEIKDVVQKGLIGTVTSTRARKAYPTGMYLKPEDWRSDINKTGGGGFIQLGVHCLDICMWIVNSGIKAVQAYSANNLSPGMQGDDLTIAITEYESGICGVFEAGYNSTGRKTEIYGSEGSIIVDEPDMVTVSLNAPYEGKIINYNGEVTQSFKTGLTREFLNSTENPYEQHVLFVKSVIDKTETPVDFSVGLYDMQIVDSVYKSAREKKYINIKNR